MSVRMNIAQHDLDSALALLDLSWARLQQTSREIILFGSRALGIEDDRSDWDILCVGHGRSRRTRRIDLLWLSPAELDGAEWLTSELAGHIARYGCWLAGEPAWTSRVSLGADAIRQKRRWLEFRLGAWEHGWPLCSTRLRRRYADLLRRNLQRHQILLEGQPVPPRQMLDHAWRALPDRHAALERMARQADMNTRFVTRELIPLADPV